MSETTRREESSARWEMLAWGLALLSVAGGGLLVGRNDRAGVTGGVLLLVAGLGFLGVALGGRAYGPRVEGRLDLSARLGLGLLGGCLGGLTFAALSWAVARAGIPALLGVDVSGPDSAFAWLGRAWHGTVWGLVLGVLHPLVPGRSARTRGIVFSLIPALYVLLKVYPLDRDAGWFGVELGALTFLFVLLYHLAWGLVAGSVLRWGENVGEGPVSRHLVE